MPILKAAKKALRGDARKHAQNDKGRRIMREAMKSYRALIVAKSYTEATKLLPIVFKALDKAAKIGVIKKNTASRKKSRLSKLLAKTA